MPTPWRKQLKQAGQLTVFNKATTWAIPVAAAIRSFNSLSFGVKLVAVKEEKAANIVVVLAPGPTKYDWPGNQDFEGYAIKTRAGFKADILHGETRTAADPNAHEIVFA